VIAVGRASHHSALIEIIGSEQLLRVVADVPDLNVVQSSVEPRGEYRWKVAAYASDDAVDAAVALGAEVHVLLSTQQDLEQRRELAGTIAEELVRRGRS
jgi:hypothetical protein